MDIVELYGCLSRDVRLQRNWERNQPRVDRCLEAPLMVSEAAREVATAALLVIKLCFEPQAHKHLLATCDRELIAFRKVRSKAEAAWRTCWRAPKQTNSPGTPQSIP